VLTGPIQQVLQINGHVLILRHFLEIEVLLRFAPYRFLELLKQR
jgi:hypothetical protein